MVYALLATVTSACSSVGAALIVVKFSRDWQIRASSVRWLFTVFFAYLFVHTTARVVYYAWLAALLSSSDPSSLLRPGADAFTTSELDRLGIHALLHLRAGRNGLMVAVVALGDVSLFAAAFWIFALTYELSKILSVTMDRGAASERAKVRVYAWVGHALIAVFAGAELAIAVAFNGYSSYAHTLLLLVYSMQIASLAYMVAILVALKLKGRNVESIHGRFESSPIYRRLKCIMYAALKALIHLQSAVSSDVAVSWTQDRVRVVRARVPGQLARPLRVARPQPVRARVSRRQCCDLHGHRAGTRGRHWLQPALLPSYMSVRHLC